MKLLIRNMVTNAAAEHKIILDINVKNNLMRLSVDKSFDLSYLMKKEDINALKSQNFDALSIRAAIFFWSYGEVRIRC